MIQFNKYSGKELQNFISILEQCKIDKLIKISQVEREIKEYLSEKLFQRKAQKVESNVVYKVTKNRIIECPSCKRGHLTLVINNEGLNIFGCPICRYSEIREVKNVK